MFIRQVIAILGVFWNDFSWLWFGNAIQIPEI